MRANITGHAAMVAYNMLLGIIPVALLALFVAGQILSSSAVQMSVLRDLRGIFPGSTEHTLKTLLDQIQDSTTSTGVLALLASLWLASSFWGALDTAFGRIYGCPSRSWLEQKRFGLAMVGVVLLFMLATVGVPTVQSILRAGVDDLPLDLARVNAVVYVISLAVGVTLLFACLALIYSRVPNWRLPWRAVWPGALGATVAISVVDYAFPAYLDEHFDHRPVRHHDRFRADCARLVLRARADHSRRRDCQRAPVGWKPLGDPLVGPDQHREDVIIERQGPHDIRWRVSRSGGIDRNCRQRLPSLDMCTKRIEMRVFLGDVLHDDSS